MLNICGCWKSSSLNVLLIITRINDSTHKIVGPRLTVNVSKIDISINFNTNSRPALLNYKYAKWNINPLTTNATNSDWKKIQTNLLIKHITGYSKSIPKVYMLIIFSCNKSMKTQPLGSMLSLVITCSIFNIKIT